MEKFIDQKNQSQPPLWYQAWDLIRFVLICLAIVIPIRIFIAQPFIVNGESMQPTFQHHDYLIVDQISYRLHEPQRGDVAIFKPPNDPSRFLIKRIIGLPGETVQLTGKEVTIINNEHPEGFTLEEDYIARPVAMTQSTTLADDEYFVMGDNRPNSHDSRFFGPLPEDMITGRAWLRILPFKTASFNPGTHRHQYDGLEITTNTSDQ